MMDKHTRRYLYQRFDYMNEEANAYEIGDLINQANSEDDYIYLNSAANQVEDDFAKRILKEQLFKKKMGW
ncbi:hypothetical protein [Niallia sp.]|uniref:hypothetical protein n=1 Tax=Niallia sp. TaxID=2837523 RepID=UPI0028A1F852|nr:hypothetical protein [Niallia sp.]